MHGRVPVVASIECRREFAGRSYIRIAVEGMADVVRILFVDAGKSEVRETLGGFDVKHGCVWMLLGESRWEDGSGKQEVENAFHWEIL